MTRPPETQPLAAPGKPRNEQLPRRMVVLVLITGALLALYTTHKMHRMAMIRGIVGDVASERHTVSDKRKRSSARTAACFLLWSDPSANLAGIREVQADCDFWQTTRIGDPIDVVFLDGDTYLRGDGEIYASTGNFVVDVGLLAAELVLVIVCAKRLRRRPTEAHS